MPKVNKEKATDATINPPHPGDPTSDVTRTADGSSGEPLHKPPQEGAWMDADGVWHAREEHEDYVEVTDDSEVVRDRGAAVPSTTGRDHFANGDSGPAQSPYLGEGDAAQQWRDDPMPSDAREVLDWAQRGTDTDARINAALRAENARGARRRSTVVSGLEALRAEHRRNESDSTAASQ